MPCRKGPVTLVVFVIIGSHLGTIVPVGPDAMSHRGGQETLRVRAGCMEEVRSPQVEEMWGKVSLAEGKACMKAREA